MEGVFTKNPVVYHVVTTAKVDNRDDETGDVLVQRGTTRKRRCGSGWGVSPPDVSVSRFLQQIGCEKRVHYAKVEGIGSVDDIREAVLSKLEELRIVINRARYAHF